MTDYCFFTIQHPLAKRVYIRGVMNITQPIDDYNKIIRFGEYMSKELPSNPYKKEESEYTLFEELITTIKENFTEICDEFVFAKTHETAKEWDNHLTTEYYDLDYEKVII